MRLFSIRPGITFRGRKFKGMRGWAGKPTHPPLTDIPITAYVFAGIFDLISFIKGSGDVAHSFFVAATYVLIAGAIVSLATALTGFWDWWKGLDRDFSTGPLGRAKHTQVWRTTNWHMTVMLIVTAIVIIDIIVRLAGFGESTGAGVLILSLIAAVLVAYGATYGGSLVFDYQFNVEQLEDWSVWDESETDKLPGGEGHPS